MYYVYILRCEKNFLYTGITKNIERRFKEHCDGTGKGAKYTRSHKPLGVEAVWEAQTKSDASRLEYRIKKLKKEEKEAIILKPNEDFVLETAENECIFKRIL